MKSYRDKIKSWPKEKQIAHLKKTNKFLTIFVLIGSLIECALIVYLMVRDLGKNEFAWYLITFLPFQIYFGGYYQVKDNLRIIHEIEEKSKTEFSEEME